MQREPASALTSIALAAALLLCAKPVKPNADNGLNAAAFASLCGIYTLKDAVQPADWATGFDNEDDIISSIFNANLSTATASWLETKDNTPTGSEGTSERQAALKEWLAEVKKRQAIKPEGTDDDTYKPVPETPFKQLANVEINSKHQQAAKLGADFKNQKSTVVAAYQKAIEHIKKAIYGEAGDDYTGAGMSATKQHTCGDGTNGHAEAGYSVVNDMICLCTPAASPLGKPCGQKAFDQVNANPTSTKATAGKNLLAACRKPPSKETLTPELIQSRIATFYAQIGAQTATATDGSAHYVLGLATDTGCTGSSQAECVNYVHQLKTPGTGINWIKELNSATKILSAA
uniref:Variant surface glycoprotein 1613 n=1 Tax=Trypanosoma brucei TaxID=5691 RepID=M4SVU4_9TRYP|nr:variant surface glycoprotein 1613 [Trypanosoma brucei]